MTWRLTLEWLPDNDESKAQPHGHARICYLEKHGDTADFHAYFEANEPALTSDPPPYVPNDPRATFHKVSSAEILNYPRYAGSAWDLVAAALVESGRGRPIIHRGLTLADIPGG